MFASPEKNLDCITNLCNCETKCAFDMPSHLCLNMHVLFSLCNVRFSQYNIIYSRIVEDRIDFAEVFIKPFNITARLGVNIFSMIASFIRVIFVSNKDFSDSC